MQKIIQTPDIILIQSKKTVGWLVDNTDVSVFDPISFKGYQRQIDNTHCEKIVNYLKDNFLLPTAIICASDEEYNEDIRLRIVDGQHRIHAFKMLRDGDPARYEEIKDYEIPIVVLSKVDISIEIATFITINKTSKKVDTSLAYVLKNQISRSKGSSDLIMSRAEYLSVEVAYQLNYEESSIWYKNILFEGSVRNTPMTISLNAFVKSTRVLINQMARNKIINLEWQSGEMIEYCVDAIKSLITEMWRFISQDKWPQLFSGSEDSKRIIQGSIGYSAINRVIIEGLKRNQGINSIEALKSRAILWIDAISVDYRNWFPGNRYSQFSSLTGYNIVAKELLDSM